MAKKKRVTTNRSTVKKKPTRRKATTVKGTARKKKLKCFVMMPFKAPFDIYYETIYKPAIEKTELKPIRSDDLFRPSVIVSDIWQLIQKADAIVAELTTKNANVFYELGLAHAIGKPVVLVSETMDDVPFDLQQLRILLYDKDDPDWGGKLRTSLSSALRETLESPIEAVPNVFRKTVESSAPVQDITLARIGALEEQVRGLRAKGMVRRREPSFQGELSSIETQIELIKWVKKWSEHGLATMTLKSFVEDADNIPPGQENLIDKWLAESKTS